MAEVRARTTLLKNSDCSWYSAMLPQWMPRIVATLAIRQASTVPNSTSLLVMSPAPVWLSASSQPNRRLPSRIGTEIISRTSG